MCWVMNGRHGFRGAQRVKGAERICGRGDEGEGEWEGESGGFGHGGFMMFKVNYLLCSSCAMNWTTYGLHTSLSHVAAHFAHGICPRGSSKPAAFLHHHPRTLALDQNSRQARYSPRSPWQSAAVQVLYTTMEPCNERPTGNRTYIWSIPST